MKIFDLNFELIDVLSKCWSGRTSVCFDPDNAPLSYGQCAPTAIVIFETFGGEILKTELTNFDNCKALHFYNRIDGKRYDFTEAQLKMSDQWLEVSYQDIPSNVEEALSIMLPGQIEAMRYAFKNEFEKKSQG